MSHATHYDALKTIVAAAMTAIDADAVYDARGSSLEDFLQRVPVRYPAAFFRGSHFYALPDETLEDGEPPKYRRDMILYVASMPNGADVVTMIDDLIAYLRDTANAYDLDDGTSWVTYVAEGIDQEEQFQFPVFELRLPLSQSN